ncbi:MAG: hypothetical protein IPK94_06660 [Saprospiraceae bacterium]|nr:hypothetical protein [Saprospiraceae bacterium]
MQPHGKKSPYYLLDLGEVRGTASILLNDLPVATCLGPEYKAIIPASAFHKSKNKLEITVSSTMTNRIIYMEQHDQPWKKFYNVNMPAKSASNRGADGLFTTKGWSPKSAGLLGPVRLVGVGVD